MKHKLAYEIRNPLGVIKGSAEMLQQKFGESNPLAGELAGYISSETNRLGALGTRFFDFARPLHAELVPHEITAVLDRALHDVSLSVARNNEDAVVSVERQYEADLPLVPLDEDLSGQAFVNLLQNAYAPMASGGGELRVSMSRAHTINP